MTELSRHHGYRARRRRSPPACRPGRPGPVGPGRGGELSDAAEAAVRGYLERRPDATVVVLGEGLGTGFRRLDNGRLTWLSVLPPQDAAARRLLLPDGSRRRTVGCAGSGADWPDVVGAPEGGVVVAVPRTPAGCRRARWRTCSRCARRGSPAGRWCWTRCPGGRRRWPGRPAATRPSPRCASPGGGPRVARPVAAVAAGDGGVRGAVHRRWRHLTRRHRPGPHRCRRGRPPRTPHGRPVGRPLPVICAQ
ncbi:class I SAM-dependent methyltransferase [Streptomyces noursei]|nr:class I SAM-dependent methyltransferase [Streptomyces noursei]